MNKRYIFCLSLLLAAFSLFSYSLTDSVFGNRILSYDARSLAMGNTGITNGARPMYSQLNPAVTASLGSKLAMEFSFGSTQLEETRSLPFFNQFDNYVEDEVYAANTHGYADYAGAITSSLKYGRSTYAVGLDFMPIVDFGGKYREEIRNSSNSDLDTYPNLIARNAITNKGKLNSGGINIAYMIDLDKAKFSLGLKYASLIGTNDQSTTIRWTQWAIDQAINAPNNWNQTTNTADPGHNILPDYTKTVSRDLYGTQMQAGFTAQYLDRVIIGFKYTPKTDITVSNLKYENYQEIFGEGQRNDLPMTAEDSLLIKDYSLPTSLKFGFSYTPRNIFRTVFNAEVEVVEWKQTNKFFDNVVNYSVGLEHGINERFPLRMGFNTETTFQTIIDNHYFYANKIMTPTISAGTGYAMSSKVYFDFGIAYSFRNFEALDLFKDTYYNDKQYNENASNYLLWPNSSHSIVLTNRGWENPDSVKESFVKVLASITYTW
ncbi:MAG TPA: hypothetical protein PLE74_00615 [Candidatus Cloacimonadota bacterium]|nr:hypothetical protein [Candidatus Cloacimonadota bacterium]HPT70763.1 hypothetical protein [Candidatus Cloacimonadota bacterium]